MDNNTIVIEIKRGFTAEQINDIMCTACEGGIGYWVCATDTELKYKETPDWAEITYYHESISRNIPIRFFIRDGDEVADQKGVEHEERGYFAELTLDKLKAGLQLAADQKRLPNDIEDIDSDIADDIIQLAVFGEIVFG